MVNHSLKLFNLLLKMKVLICLVKQFQSCTSRALDDNVDTSRIWKNRNFMFETKDKLITQKTIWLKEWKYDLLIIKIKHTFWMGLQEIFPQIASNYKSWISTNEVTPNQISNFISQTRL